MAKNQTLEHVVLDMIDSAFRTVKTVPLNLGGLGGAGGGVGQPPGGYIGQLPQIRVAYDITEAETLFTPSSGMSLVDNLNHIRYRINELEENGSSALTIDNWNGSPTVTNVDHITFSGGATLTELSAGHVLVEITASGGGTPFSGDANSVVLTDGSGDLVTEDWLKRGSNYIEFGADAPGKESNAGKIGYETFGSDFLWIVGAGTTTPRQVKLLDDVYVDGNLFANGGQQILASKQVTNGDSHDHNGGDGGQINHTTLASIGTNTHAQIDTHIANTSNPHSVTATQVAAIPDTGWIPDSATWTRTGNHTFTVSGDRTLYFRKGTKIYYVDGGGDEYGVVGSSTHSSGTTTVNLIPNTDFAMAAATIAPRSVSHIDNPQGFPHWFNYTPTASATAPFTWTSVTISYAIFRCSGSQIEVAVQATGTTGGTAGNQLLLTPPVTILGSFSYPIVASVIDGTAQSLVGLGAANGGSGFIFARKQDNSNFGLGASRLIQLHGTYPF